MTPLHDEQNKLPAEGGTHGLRADLAYSRLRELVVKGRLVPDEPVTESRICELLGISRTPVRRALSRLANEGFLVASTHGRRTELKVSRLSAGDLVELFGLMAALEGLCIQTVSALGAERCTSLARELRAVNDELVGALDRRPWDPDLVADLNSRFHVSFMDVCAGPRVLAIYSSVRPHVERYDWAFGTHGSADYRLSADEHLAIIDAVETGDGGLAKRLIEQHWEAGAERTSQSIERSRAHR